MRLLIGPCSKMCLFFLRNDEEKASFFLFHLFCLFFVIYYFHFSVFFVCFCFVLFCFFFYWLTALREFFVDQPQRVEHVLSSASARNEKDVMTISISLLIG